MSAIAVAVVGSAAIGAIASNNASNKAAKATRDAASASQVDINALDEKTREMANKNAVESAALERKLTPEVPALRKAANEGVLAGLSSSNEDRITAKLMGELGQPVAGDVQTPLLAATIAKAKEELALDGNVPLDVRNQVARSSLANAAGVGGGGLGLGRDLLARDLGLTSMDLMQRRLENAATLGGLEEGQQEFNTSTKYNNATNLLNQIQLLNAINSNKFARNLSAAQYGESIAQPVVGLDPSSVADIYAGNASNKSSALSNQASIYGAQGGNYMQTAGQLGSAALMAYGMKK